MVLASAGARVQVPGSPVVEDAPSTARFRTTVDTSVVRRPIPAHQWEHRQAIHQERGAPDERPACVSSSGAVRTKYSSAGD